MDTLITTINGKIVRIPNYEVPALMKVLVDHIIEHPASKDKSIRPDTDYMSYEECQLILHSKYGGVRQNHYAGRLWGIMCRLTQRKALVFQTQCQICRDRFERTGIHLGFECTHMMARGGCKSTWILKESITLHCNTFMRANYPNIGPAIKADYQYVVDALSK